MYSVKVFLFYVLLFVFFAGVVPSFGAEKRPPIYLSEKGERLETTDALLSAIKGAQVYKCVLTEAKVSKSGTSISLKNVKQN